jgi:hypothetical protein
VRLKTKILLFVTLFPLLMLGQDNNFKVFFEKAYIHSDKTYYAAGEDIWFKAYLVNAQTGLRISTSKVLYVELISPVAKVLYREVIALQNGLGEGDFSLPANAASGNYRIRAYTNWMQNFGDLFIFEKTIQVAAEPSVKSTIPGHYNPSFVKEALPNQEPGKNQLGFYPEGGSLVAGVTSQVGFKAADLYGKGISITGKIIDSKGDSVTSFTTSHAGLGSFVFTPVAGMTYKATGKYFNNEMFETGLPVALNSGYTLGVLQSGSNVFLKLNSVPGAAVAANAKLLVIVRNAGKKVFTDSSFQFAGNEAVINITKSALPQGINIVTLYDEKRRPACERLFYVENKPPVNLRLATDKSSYSNKEKATVKIEVTNAQGEPVQARLSLAATNAAIIPSAKNNIVSYLGLESEIRGDIENPIAYFDVANTKRLQQLDLLLLTQGWRQFVWRRLLDTSVVIKYMPEPGITLSGRVQKLLGKKGLAGMNVTLYAEKSSGDKLFLTKTREDGRFFMDGLPLHGRQDVRFSARNGKTMKREGLVTLDSLYGKPYPVSKITDLVFDTSAITHNFWRQAARSQKIMRDEYARDRGDLENVTVVAERKLIRLAEDVGMPFGADSFYTISTSDAQYKTLENFILQRYPGAVSNADQDGFFFYGERGARLRPRWVVDGSEDRFSTGNSMDINEETGQREGAYDRVDYFNIPINKVKSVSVTPFYNQRSEKIFVVQLSLLPGALDLPDFTILNATIDGYYQARKYYEPGFESTNGNLIKSDLRSTLFWSPTLQTDANGKASVTYTNNTSPSVQVCVQGITDTGVPVAGILTYPVK